MKKDSFALFTFPALLIIAPAALADSFNFNFTGVGNTISVTGTFEATEIGSTGVYNITGIENGSFTDRNAGLDIVNALIVFTPDGSGLAPAIHHRMDRKFTTICCIAQVRLTILIIGAASYSVSMAMK